MTSTSRSEAAKKGVATRAAKRVADGQAEAVVEGGRVAVDLGLVKTAQRIGEQLMRKPDLCYKVASLLEEDLLESMLLGSADVQAADKASQRVRFRASCKKFKNLPDYMVKTTCEAIQPLFNSTFDAQTCGESKLMYLCYALGVELDTWLPSHYIEECWYQDAFIDMCRARYTELGCRLAVLPATAKLWSFDADTGKAMIAMCGKQIEFAIPSCPVPVPEDASIDNPFGLSCKFLCPSAFVTVPLVEVVKALPDEQVGELRVQLLDPSSPWEKKEASQCKSFVGLLWASIVC